MRRAAKVDANQEAIVRSLRQIPGVSVRVLSQVGDGFPDLCLGYRGENFLIELKDGEKTASRKKLTPEEEKFFESWRGQVAKCETLEEILTIINKRKKAGI